MIVNKDGPEGPANGTWADIRLSQSEQGFTQRFNHEIHSGRTGPASSWLSRHALSPGQMVAFQWAMDPRGRLRSDECYPTTCPIPFESPWPTAKSFVVRVAEIVETYPWLRLYVTTVHSTPSGYPEEDATPIPMYRLIRGRYYVGRGRNGHVGRWNGQHFLVVGEKDDGYVVYHEAYEVERWGCFRPARLIDEG